jgi:hypothetical protein
MGRTPNALLPIWVELVVVVVIALTFFVLAFRGLSHTE